jgi:hypothetical protein
LVRWPGSPKLDRSIRAKIITTEIGEFVELREAARAFDRSAP